MGKQAERVILFVCTGNTCRSPMAAALAGAAAAGLPAGEAPRVMSAGIGAVGGEPMTREAREALLAMGVRAPAHRARRLTRDLVQEADAVYAMTRAHAEGVAALDPSARGKVSLLDPEGGDIPDPIGQPARVYSETARRIAALIARRMKEHTL